MSRRFPEMRANQVTVLRADCTALDNESRAAEYQSWLNHGERQRLQQYRRPDDQHMFLLGRALLRASLGHLTGIAPDAIDLRIDPHGKPACRSWRGHAFNLSHSGGVVVLALAPTAAVGIDVEAIDAALDWSPIASDHFADAERAELAALPLDAQIVRFYRYWTLKEAYGKAQGTGIVTDLRQTSFCAMGGHRYQRRQTGNHRQEFLWARQMGAGHALALATIGAHVDSVEIWKAVPGHACTATDLGHS
jgi:4'-phosphopantetheinyl transferase